MYNYTYPDNDFFCTQYSILGLSFNISDLISSLVNGSTKILKWLTYPLKNRWSGNSSFLPIIHLAWQERLAALSRVMLPDSIPSIYSLRTFPFATPAIWCQLSIQLSGRLALQLPLPHPPANQEIVLFSDVWRAIKSPFVIISESDPLAKAG